MSPVATPRLSAHALDELGRCPRKFALKYLQQTFWPGCPPDPDPTSANLGVGQAFHLLVQMHAMGLPVEASLEALADDGGRLRRLWSAFEASPHALPASDARLWTEQQLNFFLGGVSFNVRYDRLLLHEGRWTIVDWKTGRVKDDIDTSWQTRLYRLALVEAGLGLGLGPIAPETVTLLYWEVETGRGVPLPYDARAHAADRALVEARAAEASRPFNPYDPDESTYPRNLKHCRQCGFYSLCNRQQLEAAQRVEIVRRPRFVTRTP